MKPKYKPPATRGRGRPPGSKNKPKNIIEYVIRHIDDPLAAPEPPIPIRFNRLAGDEQKAWARFLNAKRTAQQVIERAAVQANLGYTQATRAPNLTTKAYADIRSKAEIAAEEMYTQMKDEDLLPDSELAKAALKRVMVILNEPAIHSIHLSAAKILLDFTKQKPATKSDVTVNAAEAFLDALDAADGA